MRCEICNGDGWLISFNTKGEVYEIQRCDECKKFESDENAGQFFTTLFDEMRIKYGSRDVYQRARWTEKLAKQYFGKHISTTSYSNHIFIKEYQKGIIISVRGQNKLAIDKSSLYQLSTAIELILKAEEVAKHV